MTEQPANPDNERMVWDVFENCWVTLDYWEWVNGR